MVEIQRIYVFLAIFTIVYFLEAIGGTYMVTAVQNIERHFRIPSKLSGLLVSAHDISYVLTVVLVSYYGSRGTIVMAVAHILTASSNYLFRSNPAKLNLTQMEVRLRPNASLLESSPLTTNISTLKEFFDFEPIRDRISPYLREALILATMENRNYSNETSMVELPKRPIYAGENKKSGGDYALDEPLMGEVNLKIFSYPLIKIERKYRISLNNP
ncbi:unnamed protein product [Meloidogyne enterolobii]|uniref:Uncharacterized protein n=1 Tax=Meloidogyne enterolobii TaxID=390850 RepID=A0ACB1AF17_MELEN